MNRLIFLFTFFWVPLLIKAQQNTFHLLVGTYTGGKSEGIYVYKFDAETGKSSFESKTAISNPSFLALSSNQKYVYAVQEEKEKAELAAFSFDAATGNLQLLNKQYIEGAHPCYVSISKTGSRIFTANYTSGSFTAFSAKKDGSLNSTKQMIVHEGHGSDNKRQASPHVHEVVLSPDEKFLLVPDLGIDKVMVYPVDTTRGYYPIKSNVNPVAVKPGSGPRHITFHPNGRYAYLIQELSAFVTVFEYNEGQLKTLQTVHLTDQSFKGEVSAADIHVSPDGKFLYASNRGDANEIVVFAVDAVNGLLTYTGRQSSLGKTPRNFNIDPTGNYLLVANQNSDNIVVFKRDMNTGLLTDTGQRIEVGNPSCLVFGAVK